jgi:hypothetical protein
MEKKPPSKDVVRKALYAGAALAVLIGVLFLVGVFGEGKELIGYCLIGVGVADTLIATLLLKD